MSNLIGTSLPHATVKALENLGVRTSRHLLDCTGEFIQSKLPGHYLAINQWITAHKFVREGKKPAKPGPRGVLNHKLTEMQVLTIRKLYNKNYSLSELAQEFGVAVSTIHRIAHNESWKKLA